MTLDPITLSQALIRCKSVTPVDDGAMAVVENALTSMGFSCHRLPFGEGKERVENLYARLGTAGPNLCFAGHVDVVPPGDINAWTHPPFGAEITDGILYGRGAVDMKCAVAAWISAISAFKKQKMHFNGSLSLLITGDEESAALHGTRKVVTWLKEKGETIDACIVGEPTNPLKLGEMAKIGRRGSVSFELTVHGTQGHVAYPDLAENPITHMVRILADLKKTPLDGGNEFFPPSNLEITTVDVANSAGNVIPASAKARFNIRFNPLHTSDDLTKWLSNAITFHTARFELKKLDQADAFITKPGVLSSVVQTAVKEITSITPELTTTGGTSDARFIKDLCPVVEFGLINATAHKVDEQIAVKDIEQLTQIYSRIIENFFKNA